MFHHGEFHPAIYQYHVYVVEILTNRPDQQYKVHCKVIFQLYHVALNLKYVLFFYVFLYHLIHIEQHQVQLNVLKKVLKF